jgi:hypothetical protein
MSIKIISKVGPAPEIEIPIKCANCGEIAAKLRARDAAPGTIVDCKCGTKIKLTGDDSRKMQRALDDLHKTLKNFGRR